MALFAIPFALQFTQMAMQSSILTLIGSDFANRYNSRATTVVRIYAGVASEHPEANLGGHVPHITLWDDRGRFWGHANGHHYKLKPENFIDVPVRNSRDENNTPTYISLVAGGHDALCIAGIAFTFPDGTNSMWLGDTGQHCGFTYFGSETKIGKERYQPRCVWLDGDHTNNLPQGLSFHIPDFDMTRERNEQFNKYPGLVCKNRARIDRRLEAHPKEPIHIFNPVLKYNRNGTDADISNLLTNLGGTDMAEGRIRHRRSLPEFVQGVKDMFSNVHGMSSKLNPGKWLESTQHSNKTSQITASRFASTVVVSNSTSHSARQMCEDPNAWGPDIVSLQEQIYCDMTTRSHWPVCTAEHRWACFDLETNEFRGLSKSGDILDISSTTGVDGVAPAVNFVGSDPGRGIVSKTYRKVLNWDCSHVL